VNVYVNGAWLADCYPGDQCTLTGAACIASLDVSSFIAAGMSSLQVNLTYSSSSSYFCDVFRATVVLDVADKLVTCPPSFFPCAK
jgi:hypothetical protein